MVDAPTLRQSTKALRETSRRADTAYTIVSATVLEDLLEQALLAQMRDLSKVLMLACSLATHRYQALPP